MALKEFAKTMLKNALKNGWANSDDFPRGTILNWGVENGEYRLILTLPNHEEYIVTHDKVKYATILAMGVIDINKNNNKNQLIHGTKYKVEFSDGKTAIIVSDMATSDIVETVLF